MSALGFTGIDDPYEPPTNGEIVMEPIEGRCPSPTHMAEQLMKYLEERSFFVPPA
jgi:adenylylsulfate kinase